jgi:hypothetical protein
LTDGRYGARLGTVRHRLRVTDEDGLPVQLIPGRSVEITVDGSEGFEGEIVSSDEQGVTTVDFEEDVYTAYRAARDSERPAARFRNFEA